MDSPTVSVVMSVFNGQAFLPEAIDSILGQTFSDFEFIVINDGSTDWTAEILAGYAQRDARMRVVHQENKGRTESLNIGMGLAKGEYIARMDADDVALPNRLKEQLDFMDRHPEVGLLGGAVELISREGNVLRTVRAPLEDSEIKSLMLQYNPMCHPAVLLRKEVALAAGGYRRAFSESEDYDLWLRMSERSRLANLGDVVLLYRIHSSQVSIGNMKHQALCALVARAAALSRRRGSPDPLSGVAEITPELAQALGLTSAEIQQALVGTYRYWMDLVGPGDPKAALRVIDTFLQSADSAFLERRVLADVCLKAAGIYYRQGRPIRALFSAGRGILLRPIVAGRPVKGAFMRFTGALRS